ncbi:MAG: OmpA family protein [Acidobacteria bacterium]|nr:OmpA family protein [Acidobacteriota bacterium]
MIPLVVNKLTPDGILPSEESLAATVANFNSASVPTPEPPSRPHQVRDPEPLEPADGSNNLLTWLLPLILLGILIVLGYWFCGKSSAPANVNTANTNANRTAVNANANTAAPVIESSFKLEAKDGKYVVTGVVHDQKTFDDIKAALDAQFGAANVDLSGLKIDAKAKQFPDGWWANFTKLLPNLKDWKTGVLAFAGNVITEANGLPSAAVDQIKSLFAGWKLPDVFGNAPDVERVLSELSLPDGSKLQAYPGGIEDELIKFIASDDYKNGTNDSLKDKWFNFDDLNFEFGTTNLTPASKRQLDNIVAILKAFPDAKIKVGGYTDKKGDDAANLKLSDGRAKAVQAALQKAGVGAQVPEAEGYGEQFATVDENADDKEREKDRKTAVRLLK